MRFYESKTAPASKGDLTPMIDMTFQLIAFFMLLVNFTDAEQDQRVRLPESILAVPPDEPYEERLTIQLASKDVIIFAGSEFSSLDQLSRALLVEKQILEAREKKVSDTTIIIRADRESKTGKVQEIIQACQTLEFLKFALRGKQAEVRVRSPSN
ncbi:MAG: biopolymer transporter ExbD [Pirellulales bacterium]|nr:biopolymer transporter ExbD [Pirellulales bacterium]